MLFKDLKVLNQLTTKNLLENDWNLFGIILACLKNEICTFASNFHGTRCKIEICRENLQQYIRANWAITLSPLRWASPGNCIYMANFKPAYIRNEYARSQVKIWNLRRIVPHQFSPARNFRLPWFLKDLYTRSLLHKARSPLYQAGRHDSHIDTLYGY